MAAEYPRLLTLLYSRLHSDAVLAQAVATAQIAAGILPAGSTTPAGDWLWKTAAPQGATYPGVLVQVRARPDVDGMGGARIWSALLVTVKVIGQTASTLTLQPIADRLDDLCQNWYYTGTDLVVDHFLREEPVVDDGPENGIWYTHLGGKYKTAIYIPPA